MPNKSMQSRSVLSGSMLKKSLILSCVLYSQMVQASAVDDRFSYQDYIDFGSNKGRFTPGIEGITINPRDPNSGASSVGLSYKCEAGTCTAPMIDFSASNQTGNLKGEFTNIGGNRVISAAHMFNSVNPNALDKYKSIEFGGVRTAVVDTSNNFADYYSGCSQKPDGKYTECVRTDIQDFVTMRMSKLNLNKSADIISLDLYDADGKDSSYEKRPQSAWGAERDTGKGVMLPTITPPGDTTPAKYEPNLDYPIFVRSGTGLQASVNKNHDNTTNPTYIGKAGNYFTGSLAYVGDYQTTHEKFGIYTISIYEDTMGDFASTAARGDSGSALYAWDAKKSKWVVVGVVSSSNCESSANPKTCSYGNYHMVNKYTIQAFDTKHSVTANGNIIISGDKLVAGTTELVRVLDITNAFKHYYGSSGLAGSGKITQDEFQNRLKAMQNDDKDIYITGGESLTLSAKTDIGSSALIFNPNMSRGYSIDGGVDFLHGGLDIGKNTTVTYNVTTAKNDYLHKIGAGKLIVTTSSENAGIRIGGGLVEYGGDLKTKAFGNVYMTGDSKLKLSNADQLNTERLYINSGEIDLNGVSLSFSDSQEYIGTYMQDTSNALKAGSQQAKFTNSSTTQSTITLSKTKNGVFHGMIDSDKITLNQTNSANTTYLYDGGLRLGAMSLDNGTTALQGHPVIHGYVPADVLGKIYDTSGVYTTPTKADQDDWQERAYKIGTLDLTNGAKLEVLKQSSLDVTTATATGSSITIGADKAYTDAKDGENIYARAMYGTDNSENINQNLTYQDELRESQIVADKVGKIEVKIGSLKLDNSSLSVLNGAHYTGNIKGINSLAITFDKARYSGQINTDGELVSNGTTYTYKTPTDYIHAASARGSGNIIAIDSAFVSSDQNSYALADIGGAGIDEFFSATATGLDSVFSSYEPNIVKVEKDDKTTWCLNKKGVTTCVAKNLGDSGSTGGDGPSTGGGDGPSTGGGDGQGGDTGGSGNTGPSTGGGGSAGGSGDGDKDSDAGKDQEGDKGNTDKDSADTAPAIPLDPNPATNPSNTETPGHYKEYFFVKEHTHAIQTAKRSLDQVFFSYVLEWNNLQKRMGELRNADGQDAGVWMRAYGGSSTYLGQSKTSFGEMQLGMDRRTEYDGWALYTGALLSMATYDMSAGAASGSVKGYGGGAYLSAVSDSGIYLDIIAKYIDYQNDFDITIANGNGARTIIHANNNQYSIIASAELGYRAYITDRAYIEPSVELISGRMGAQHISNPRDHVELEVKSFAPLNIKSMLHVGLISDECSPFGLRAGVGYAADLVPSGQKRIRDLNVVREYDGSKDARILSSISAHYMGRNGLRMGLEAERTFGGDLNTDYALSLTLRYGF